MKDITVQPDITIHQAMKKLSQSGEKCLVILPDAIRNYLSKFVDDSWMEEQGFLETA